MDKQLIKEILEYLLEKLEKGKNTFDLSDLTIKLEKDRNEITITIAGMLITEFIKLEVIDADNFKIKNDVYDIATKIIECKKPDFKLKNRNLI